MQLFVEGKNLVDMDFFTVSDPICTLKTREANLPYAVYRAVGETEVIDNNLNPCWIKHFTTQYIFNKDTELYFQVWNYNSPSSKDLIGEVQLTLSEVMMAPGQTTIKTLNHPDHKDKSRGMLKIRGDKIKNTEDPVKFQIEANLISRKILCIGSDNPYLLIERARNISEEENKEERAYMEALLAEQMGKNYVPPEEDSPIKTESWYSAEMKNRKPKKDNRTCGEKFRQWIKGGQAKDFVDEGDFVKVYKTQYKFDK